jgi:hypothetical protein
LLFGEEPFASASLSDQEEPRDANSGEPWSEMDIADLTNSLAHGDTFAQTARFLCRDEDEARQKAKELRLVQRTVALFSKIGA